MSKKIVEDSDLQTLTLSPTNTNEDESSLLPVAHDESQLSSSPSNFNNPVSWVFE